MKHDILRICHNCKWNGFETIDPYRTCPVCGDDTEEQTQEQNPQPTPEPKEELKVEKPTRHPFDLDGDGDVDKDDASIASKVLRSFRKPKGRPKGSKNKPN